MRLVDTPNFILLTLTERKTREELIFRADSKNSQAINTIIKQLRHKYGTPFHQIFKTISSDNGSEFAELSLSVQDEKTTVYFTHPYCSSERGTNERHNGNGLIRRFIPKGKAISSVSDVTITYAEK